MAETKREYRVKVKQRYQQKEGTYSNLATYMGGIGKRSYGSLERAIADLKKFIGYNDPKKKTYRENGKRYETSTCGCGIGMDRQLL